MSTNIDTKQSKFANTAVLSACRLDNGWKIVIIEDGSQAYAEISHLDQFSLGFLFLTILLALTSSWIISRLVIHRLNRIGEEIIQAAQKGINVQIDRQRSDDEFGHFRRRVAIAMHGEQLINQLLKQSYDKISVAAFIHDALKILDTAPWLEQTHELHIYLSLEEDPDKFYSAILRGTEISSEELDFDALPSAVRNCIATNTLIKQEPGDPSRGYLFPIYLGNISGGCLALKSVESWNMSGPEAHFIVTYIDVLANIISHLSTRIALSRQEQLTTQLIDNSDLAISVRSLTGEISLFNQGFETLFGLHREDYVKLRLDSLNDEQQARICVKDNEVLSTGQTVCFDQKFDQPDGNAISFQTVKFPIKDRTEQIVGIGSVSTNISSRLQMEERLQDAYQNLESQVQIRTQQLHQSNQALEHQKTELEVLVTKLEEAQTQLLQSEKLASIGQLAAGVAHEINNPVGFVNSNLGSLRLDVANLMRLIERYEGYRTALPEATQQDIETLKTEIDFDFLAEDISQLITESIEGVGRVIKIVADLKSFSRIDSGEWEDVDIHDCIESTAMFGLDVDPELNYRKPQQLSEVSNETGRFQSTRYSHRLAQPLSTTPAPGTIAASRRNTCNHRASGTATSVRS